MGGGSKFWDLLSGRDKQVICDEFALQEGSNKTESSAADQGCAKHTDGSLGAFVDILRESRLAVDLSQWIVEGQTGSSRPGEKLYLKTIIHRV
jgi:hypothetical protein